MCRAVTYNQRSIGTLEIETFFGILDEVGSTKRGVSQSCIDQPDHCYSYGGDAHTAKPQRQVSITYA